MANEVLLFLTRSAAIIFSGIGVFLWIHLLQQKKRCNMAVEGNIVDYARERKTKKRAEKHHVSKYYYPIVAYQVQGKLLKATSMDGNTTKRYEIGDEVVVFCNPNQPTEMFLPFRIRLKFISLICIFVGMITFIFTYLPFYITP